MGKGKDLSSIEKQRTKLLNEEMSNLMISSFGLTTPPLPKVFFFFFVEKRQKK